MPSRSAPRRAFAHGLELGGDLLERAIGRRRLDAGDQPDQPIVPRLRLCAIQQACLEDAFRDQPPVSPCRLECECFWLNFNDTPLPLN